MNSSDLVADLRAEVTFWCKQLQEKLRKEPQLGDGSSQHTPLSPFSPQLHPPFRLISQGHELTPDLDEKSLAEVGFKDLQVQHSYCKVNRSKVQSKIFNTVTAKVTP